MIQHEMNIRERLLYILHLAFVESRLLAMAGKNQQIFDLADAMEVLPRFVNECGDEDLELARFVLKTYQEKYPESRFDYVARLDQYDPPPRY